MRSRAFEEHVLIVTIVESNCIEAAVIAAEKNGGEGCTLLHGRGKSIGKAECVFNVPLDASRDLMLTVVHKDKATLVQDDIFEAVGLKTAGHGLVYQLPLAHIGWSECVKTAKEENADGSPGLDKEGIG